MGQLTVFNFITLNGYYKGADDDISWHRHGHEESEFAANSVKSENILVFGRVTYEMMAGYWPSDQAMKDAPDVASGMNKAEKIVFSATMKKADWSNTTLVKDNIGVEIKKLKQIPGKNMTILGSGSIVAQLADQGLIDSYVFMLDPVALGSGTSIFNNISYKLDLELTSTKVFNSGVILLSYKPR